MKRSRCVHLIALAGLVAVLLAVVLACGDDPWSGTWTSTGEYWLDGAPGKPGIDPPVKLTIEKRDDGWVVHGFSDSSWPVREQDGRLVRTDEVKAAILELRGDKLILLGDPVDIELARE